MCFETRNSGTIFPWETLHRCFEHQLSLYYVYKPTQFIAVLRGDKRTSHNSSVGMYKQFEAIKVIKRRVIEERWGGGEARLETLPTKRFSLR